MHLKAAWFDQARALQTMADTYDCGACPKQSQKGNHSPQAAVNVEFILNC